MRVERSESVARVLFENQIRHLIQHAWLSSSTTDKASYFIGEAPSVTPAAAGLPAGLQSQVGSSAPGGSSSGAGGQAGSGVNSVSGTGSYGTPNVMVFTAAGLNLPDAYLASNDDFETLNQEFGPVGGISEVEISQDPVGQGAGGQSGIFLREQTPSDSDPTQGGNEQMISPNLSQIGFEFFDGQNWDQSWDSRSQTPAPGRMPAAVRITYRFKGDNYDHVFVVNVPASNVTYLNPVMVTG
jgi:hypothetical protein